MIRFKQYLAESWGNLNVLPKRLLDFMSKRANIRIFLGGGTPESIVKKVLKVDKDKDAHFLEVNGEYWRLTYRGSSLLYYKGENIVSYNPLNGAEYANAFPKNKTTIYAIYPDPNYSSKLSQRDDYKIQSNKNTHTWIRKDTALLLLKQRAWNSKNSNDKFIYNKFKEKNRYNDKINYKKFVDILHTIKS